MASLRLKWGRLDQNLEVKRAHSEAGGLWRSSAGRGDVDHGRSAASGLHTVVKNGWGETYFSPEREAPPRNELSHVSMRALTNVWPDHHPTTDSSARLS